MSEQLDKLRKLTSTTWLSSGGSSPIRSSDTDDEGGGIGYFSSLGNNALGGLEAVVGGTLDFAGANLKALGENETLNKWMAAQGLKSDLEAKLTGYTGDGAYRPVTQDNPTPYKDTVNKTVGPIADGLINNGEYLSNLAAEKFQQYGLKDEYQNMGVFDRLTNLDYLTDPRGLTADVGQGLGSSIPSLAATVATLPVGGAGGAAATAGARAAFAYAAKRGATKLAANAFKRGLPGKIGSAVNYATTWGLAGGGMEATSDAGSIYSELKAKGYSDSEIASRINSLAASELPYLMASDMITGGVLKGKIGNIVNNNRFLGGDSIKKSFLRGAVIGTPVSMGSEYLTEMKQQQLQNEYTDKPYGTFFNPLEDEMSAGASGAIGGLGFSMLGGARSAINRALGKKANTGNPSYDEHINNASAMYGVPTNLIQAVMEVESKGNPNAVSSRGATGLMQLMPDTAEAMGVTDMNDPAQNIMGGTKYLKSLYDKYGNWRDTLIAYNEGPGAFDEGHRYAESVAYADNVLSGAGDVEGAGTVYDVSRPIPIQGGIEDTGLKNTNRELHHAVDALNTWVYNTFGTDLTVSGGWRSKEYNAEVNGSPTSHHLNGDAIDVVIPDNFSEEQIEQIKEKAREMGFNSDGEDMYHDRGSGYHLHLTLPNGLKGTTSGGINGMDLQFDNELSDYANSLLNNSDEEETNFFKDKTIKDSNGRSFFNATNDNILAFKEKYQPAINDYRKYKNSFISNNSQQEQKLINKEVGHAKQQDNGKKNEIKQIITPALDKLKEFARLKAITTRDPNEAATLYGLFKDGDTNKNFLNDEKAIDFLNKNYTQELEKYFRSQQNNQIKVKDENRPLQKANSLVDYINNDRLGKKIDEGHEQARKTRQIGSLVNVLSSIGNKRINNTIANEIAEGRAQSKQEQISTLDTLLQQILRDKRQQEYQQSKKVVTSPFNQSKQVQVRPISIINQRSLDPNTIKNKVKALNSFDMLSSNNTNIPYIDNNTNNYYDGEDLVQSIFENIKGQYKENNDSKENHLDKKNNKKAKKNTLKKVAKTRNEDDTFIQDMFKQTMSASQQHEQQSKQSSKSTQAMAQAKQKPATNNSNKEQAKQIAGTDNKKGRVSKIVTDNGKEFNTNFKIIDIDDLVMSHSAKTSDNYKPNPKYPEKLQPRNRERNVMKQQITEMTNNLRPEDLADSRNVNNGAPIVNKDNVVLNGNGRSMAITRAVKSNRETGKKYKEYLMEHAEEFGYNKEDIAKIKNPVLIRQIDKDLVDAEIQEIINSTSGGARMSASEQAVSDADKIKLSSLDLYVDNEQGDITTPANQEFVMAVLTNISNKNDLNALLDEKGNVNADGLLRVKRTLFSLAYGDDNLIAKMAESTNDNIRNITNALLRTAPMLAKLNIEMKQGDKYKYSLAKDISSAVKVLSALRDSGQSVKNYLASQNMFNEYNDSDEAKQILKFFDDNKRKSNIMAKYLSRAVNIINELGDPKQVSMIETKNPTLSEILDRAANYATGKNIEKDLFEEKGNDKAKPDEIETKAENKPTENKVEKKAVKNEPAKNKEKKMQNIKGETSKESKAENKQSIFGDEKEVTDELFATLGEEQVDQTAQEKETAPKFVNVIDDSDENLERLKKEWLAELNNISANPIFNPKLFTIGLQIGMIYVQRGVNNFATWQKEVTKFAGNDIEPWLPALWNTINEYPADKKFDEKKMTAAVRYVGMQYEKGNRTINLVYTQFSARMKDKNRAKEYEPLFKAAYSGIKKFFDDMEKNQSKGEKDNGIHTEGPDSGLHSISRGERTTNTGENEGKGKSKPTNSRADGAQTERSRRLDSNATETNEPEKSDEGLDGTVQEKSRSGNDSVGTDKRKVEEKKPKEPLNTQTVEKVNKQPAKVNYHMSKDDGVGEGGEKTRYKNNIEAIKLLKQLEVDGRRATPKEQKTLAKYSGWGGLTSAFSNAETSEELKSLLTDEEFKAARASIDSAYYTAPVVVESIWKVVNRLGFKGGRILEPSMGVGNFFGLMPKSVMNKSTLTGVELDKISGQIATQLYQKANINIMGFEETKAPDNFFDLAIGNVPFGSIRVHDPKFNKYKFYIHNYFFAKAIDKVRPGGLVVLITSSATMDRPDGNSQILRTYLQNKADLMGAIRLPDTAFRSNTGTSVITDIIILKKRLDTNVADKNANAWENTTKIIVDRTDLDINEYYANNSEMIAGKLDYKNGRYYGGEELVVSGKDINLSEKLDDIIEKLPTKIYEPIKTPKKDSVEATKVIFAPDELRESSYTIGKSGKVYQNINGKLKAIEGKKADVVKDFVNLKNKLKQLLAAQIDNKISDAALDKIRTELNERYDTFVKNNGYLNDRKMQLALSNDPEYGLVSAVERYEEKKQGRKVVSVKAEKSDIFTKRTVGLEKKPTSADSAVDSLTISLREHGKVDIKYMANLMGKSEKEVVDGLKGAIYKDPITGEYETADEYLSGNVRMKLVQAEEAAKTNASYKENVEALEKVQPPELMPEDIAINLGASWVPASDIEQFATELTKIAPGKIKVQYLPANGEWSVTADYWAKKSTAFTETWGTQYRNFGRLLESALNQRTETIKRSNGDKKPVTDVVATTAVNDMLDRIKQEFKNWIWKDPARTKRLLDYYNTNFNNWRLREYDGSHLELPGYSLVAPKLRKHQKDAVWRIMQNQNTLLAHSVGAGKTWTMQTAAMEMRRLGICKKPVFVIPGHMIQQFENEWRVIYPNVELLVISADKIPQITKADISNDNKRKIKRAQRERILTQIATEDWDGIIISHDLFERIAMSPEAYNKFYEEQLNQLEQAKKEINAKKGTDSEISDANALRSLEKSKKSLEAKLKKDVAEEKKDIVISFEELGIDQIFVDEADKFKNLKFVTNMERISGISTTSSKRAMDMYLKTRYITKANGGRGVVFATGTPISNTLAEMFTMTRYMDEQALKDNNLSYFDNWANQFAEITRTVERNPDGNGYRSIEKASKFVNKPELIKMFRKFADVKRPEDLNLEIPKLKTGKRIVVSVEPSKPLRDFITKDIKSRAEAIRSRSVDPSEDNMLKLTGELRKASLDVRLMDPSVPESQAGSKIQALVDNVYKEYKESADTKGAQLIFCDLSTPKGTSDKSSEETEFTAEEAEKFDVYNAVKNKLIKKGIKANEIAFIHDAKNKEQKQRLFDAVNQGDVRVLLGSTEKMGAGTNCQKKLVALHHLDCPWRPRDIEQREGRILRQGNTNKEVSIYSYVTKDSFDANMWEKIKNKQHFISEALSADITQRTIEDNDVMAMSFAEAEAIATGNPLMAEKVLVDADVTKYTTLKHAFESKQARIKRELEALPAKIEETKSKLDKVTKDVKAHQDISGDRFKIKLGKKEYYSWPNAEKALEAITKKIKETQDRNNTLIGEIAGFEIKARFNPTSTTYYGNKAKVEGEIILTLIKNFAYESKNTIRSLVSTANNDPKKLKESNTEVLKILTEKQTDLTEESKRKFGDEEKLNNLLEKQADLYKKLGLDENGRPIIKDDEQDANFVDEAKDNAENIETVNSQGNNESPSIENSQPKKDDVEIETETKSLEEKKKQYADEHIIIGTIPTDDIDTTKAVDETNYKITKLGSKYIASQVQDNALASNDFHYITDDKIKDKIFDIANRHGNSKTKDEFNENRMSASFATRAEAEAFINDLNNEVFNAPKNEGANEMGKSISKEHRSSVRVMIAKIKKQNGLDFDTRDFADMVNRVYNDLLNDKEVTDKAKRYSHLPFSSFFRDYIGENANKYVTAEDGDMAKGFELIAKTVRFPDMLANEIYPNYHKMEDGTANDIRNPEDFVIDGYEHTKTKEKYTRVKLKNSYDREKFVKIKALAKQSNGMYSRFAGGFLFPENMSNEELENFFNAIDGLSSSEASYSFEEELRKKVMAYNDIRELATMLEPAEITDYERELSNFGKRIGTPIYWFTAPKGFRGWHAHGTTYLNRNGNWSHPKVFWHETFHWIAANNPNLFKDMVAYINKSPITQKQLEAYASIIHDGKNKPKEKLIEEMMADNMMNVVRRTKFLRNLGKENQSLAKRFIGFIRDIMNRFVDYLNRPKAGLTNAQKNLMTKAFNNLALSIKDERGNSLFKKDSQGEIIIDDDRNFYSISKEEEKLLIEIYGEDYENSLFEEDEEYATRFSADNGNSIDSATGTFKGAFKNIKERISGIKHDPAIKIYAQSARDKKISKLEEMSIFDKVLTSPSRVAKKYPVFKPIYLFADNAMRRLLKNRAYFSRELKKAYENFDNKKDGMEQLTELMMKGDMTATEYGKGIKDRNERADAIVNETGCSRSVALAYIDIRKLLDKAHEMVSRARQKPQTYSKVMSKSKLEELQKNKFVKVLNEEQFSEKDEDERLVTYEEKPTMIQEYVLTDEELKRMKTDEAIQVLSEKKSTIDGQEMYKVKTREEIGALNKLEGYLPHFFHDWSVRIENKDGSTTIVDSGRTLNEAVKKAEDYLKNNEGTNLVIQPKRFDFNTLGVDEATYAAIVGDNQYNKINERLAEEYNMSVDEAKHLLMDKNKPQFKGTGKHRFFGNTMKRTGAKGYEQKDLVWILSHYFNSASRYEALETEFKPKAISYYERIFGNFNNSAKYVKDYINDVNGNPTSLEEDINRILNKNPLWRKFVVSNYGDRAALQFVSTVSNTMSVLKLGVLNVSSALLNLTQLLNSIALLSKESAISAVGDVMKACYDIKLEGSIKKLSANEQKAIEESGVLDELGLDSGAGYGKSIYNKFSFGKLGNYSMVLFKASEGIARRGTVLAAYRQAIKQGKTHDEAVAYAREINNKANFDYGINDAPNIFRRYSILSQLLLQFQKYPIKQFELMRDLLPLRNTEYNARQKAVFWGGWLLLAGAFGLPAEDALWGFIGVLSNLFGFPDPKTAVKKFLFETSKDSNVVTRAAIRTMLYGVGSNVGIDISGRVGMSDLIPGMGEDYMKNANPTIKALSHVGVVGSTIAQFYESANKNGVLSLNTLRAISPGAYNIGTAISGTSYDGRGRITTKYDDILSRIIRGMGFKSTEEAVIGDAMGIKYYDMGIKSNEKQKAIDDLLDAEENGEPLGEYIKKLKELGVKPDTLKKARKNRKLDRFERAGEDNKKKPDFYKGAEALGF